jgi:hypothetical protein
VKAGRGLLTLVATLAAGALCAPLAHAGTYDVYSCKFGSSFFGNNAWVGVNNSGAGDATFTVPDATCANAADPLIALMRPAAAGGTVAYGAGVSSELRLSAPVDTRITDFTLNLRHRFSTPGNVGFNLLGFGGKGVSLAGSWDSNPAGDQAAINTERHWYGGGAAIDSGFVTLSKADSPQAQRQGAVATMSLYAGCSIVGTCTFDQNSIDQLQLLGSRVTIEDTRPPDLTAVQAGLGLLAPGVRSGDEPVTFSAQDNSGIRSAELVDVTDAANPAVVASEDYNTGPNTNAGTRCDYTRPRPCPDVKNETIAAPTPIAGHRTLILRVADAGGETTVSAPFSIQARGPLNGVNGGDGARLVAGFPAKVFRGKGKQRHAVFVLRPTHLVSYGKKATIRGTLKGADGQPIAGADVRILVREARLGAQYVDQTELAESEERDPPSIAPPSSASALASQRCAAGSSLSQRAKPCGFLDAGHLEERHPAVWPAWSAPLREIRRPGSRA